MKALPVFAAGLRCTVGLAVLGIAALAHAQISIGAGSVVDMGTAAIDIGCIDLGVDGTLNIQGGAYTGIRHLLVNGSGAVDGGTGVISLSGDFARNGSFTPSGGEFRSVDGCSSTGTMFTAGNQFNRLLVSTATGRTLQLPGNSTHTVNQSLRLAGTAGHLLQVRSIVPGSQAHINLLDGASQAISYVDVSDNHATGQVIAAGTPASFNSVQGNNTKRWFVESAAPVPVPALSVWALALMGFLSAGLGALRLRQRDSEMT